MRWMVGALVALAGCSGGGDGGGSGVPQNATVVESRPAPTPAAAAPTMDATKYLGRWTGVEGMYLVVAAKPSGVSLEMQYDLDNKGTYDGTVTAEGLRFTRNGATETARPSDGDATGLKYLAGKADCLTVKPGEGYCRGLTRGRAAAPKLTPG